jgi:indolepyruvate ferredoxin oxidoreductase
MAIDPRFLTDSGREVFTGNELLVKGALECEGGVHLLTGYPGSPVAGFFDVCGDIGPLLKQHGIRAFQANNEALGVAALNGSQMAPCRGIATMKSVGVQVASDALALGNLAGAHPQGGAILIAGDDPWCDSTQVPADSRFLFEHLRMPVVEPGTIQEMKDWLDLSFKLSREAGLYIGYIVTTAQADGGGSVECRPNQWPAMNTNQRMALDTARIDLDRVLLPPRTWMQELKIPDRFARTLEAARRLGINKIISTTRGGTGVPPVSSIEDADAQQNHGRDAHATSVSPLGFIVTGMAGPYLQHVLADIGLAGVFPILQMGMSYPADVTLVAEFSKLCKNMIVIEERRSFLEKNIRDTLFHALPHEQAIDLASRLYGKTFPAANGKTINGIPDTRGLFPSVLAQILIPLIKQTEEIPAELRNGKLSAEMEMIRRASKPKLSVISEKQIVARTPTFCPGCPHRDSSAALLEIRNNFADKAYMLREHGMGPVDMVAHGDTGCYTMLMFAPTEQLMHNYSGMGLGGGTGSGIDPFITNKQIVFMGDGTFFHSGQIAISNAIKANQDITFIILENKTTAMTGHQDHAGQEEDAFGNKHYIQEIEQIVRGMAGSAPVTIMKLSPADRSTYRSVLEKTILSDGVKILMADKECGITYNRTVLKAERKTIKEKGYLPRKTHMNITPEVCENCLECTKQTACPGLTTSDTDYGRKIDTDLTWCVNDGACERVRVTNEAGIDVKPCPSFEQITVVRKKRRRYLLPHMALDKLPDPTPVHPMTTSGEAWRVHMAGVGGMGIGVVGAILVRAGHKQGFRVIFADKKGLAIRNGGVYSQITFINDEERIGAGGSPVNVVGSALADVFGGAETFAKANPTDAAERAMPYPTTGSIPYGRADLLLAIDVLEGVRAIDAREHFRVASRDRTCSVVNLHKQPTVYTLLGQSDFDPEKLKDEIFTHSREEHSYAKNLSALCEQRLGSKQYVNIMMLGVAYQLGLIPVSAHSIAWGIKDTIRRDHRKNLKAFNIGRKLALEPRALPNRPQASTWEHLVTGKTRILRKTRLFGRSAAARYEQLVHGAIKHMKDLPEELKYDLALRIYDLMQYDDHKLARRYVLLVQGVYHRDSRARNFAATAAAIWNIAKVMLIKDEPYVAYLLTRYEKRIRDNTKYNVDESNGDRIVYRHHTSPEFNIGPWRLRFKITTTNWQLKLVSKMKWFRRLPGWHRREVGFRDWYITLLDRVKLDDDQTYAQALQALKCPEQVTGYREVRYPKQEKAKAEVESLLGSGGPTPHPASPERPSILDALRAPTSA